MAEPPQNMHAITLKLVLPVNVRRRVDENLIVPARCAPR